MIELEALKIVAAIEPGPAVSDDSFEAVSVDTAGFERVVVVFSLGATDTPMTALKLQESDNDSSYSDVAGGAMSAPSADDGGSLYGWHLRAAVHKRYLKIVATADAADPGDPGDPEADPPVPAVPAGVGVAASGFAVLSRGGQAPSTAAERGFTQELFV